jgi:chromosome segregation protein
VYLKRVELLGFKTFAERTDLVFGPGITAVVGPNGSGKSNIADAIVWALGETSLKSVRSSRSQDVIFSGSDSRRPLSLAEVSITLDNTDLAIPGEFSEVMVTRRVFRSGEGEYLINKAPCRLRDIHDMFLDTGLGRAAYSIVSQNQIDALLSLNPEDRRAIFEEAAGIQKFRHRQTEAERKLEATRTNLQRLADIIGELESQRPHLDEQARLAQQHEALTDELASVSRASLLCQAHDLSAACARLDDQQARAQQDIESAREGERSLAESLSALGQQLKQVERSLEEAHDARARIASEAQDAERAAAVAEERLRALSSRKADLAAEAEALAQSGAAALSELTREKERRAQIRSAAAKLSARGSEISLLLRPTEELTAAIQAFVQECRARHLEAVHGISGIRNRLTQAQALLRSATTALERETRRGESARQESGEIEARLSDLRRKVDEMTGEIESLRANLAGLESRRAAAFQQQSEAEDQEQQLLQEAAGLRSRLSAVEELNAAIVSGGAAAAIRASQEGRLPAGLGMVRDIVRIKPGFERAIEAALESRLEDLIASDPGAIFEILDYLAANNSGRAVVWPPDPTGPAQRVSCPPPAVAAVDVVECEARHRQVVDHLLARIIIVPDRASAVSLRDSLSEPYLVATVQGEVFYPGGAVAGGSPAVPRLSLLRETEEIRVELAARQQEAQQQAERSREAAVAAQSASEAIAATSARTAELEAALAAARVSLTTAEADAAQAKESAASLQEECVRLEAERDESQQNCAELEKEIGAANQRLAALEQAAGFIEQSGSCAGRARETAERLAAALALTVARLQGEVVSSARASGQRQRARLQALAAAQAKRGTAAAVQQEEEMLGRERDAAVTESQAAATRLEQAREEIGRLQSQRQSLDDEMVAARQSAEETRARLEEGNASLSRLQVRRAGIEAELKFVAEALQAEHSLSLADALAMERPKLSRSAAQETIASLRAQIEAVGPVNAAAANDLEVLDQRLGDYAVQKADMEKAQEDLLQIIVEIKKTAQQKFLDTFEKAKVEFQEVFSRLFGGGETELSLTDPENPLDAGVEVHVTIPGKRRQNLLLLSGGERALTALSLLLALIKVHPTPFVVLDEVDAPLDDANVGRYTELLREWAQATQFILITHNRGTMEAANTLHGVTMEKAGISKLVSVRLDEWKAEPETAAAA